MLRILVVDPADFNHNALVQALKRNGVNVLLAQSSFAAAQMLRESDDVDVVVTDLDMPEMTGLDLFQDCQEHRGDAMPPFILVTESHDPAVIGEAKRLGFTEVLLKPSTLEQALMALAHVCPALEQAASRNCAPDRERTLQQTETCLPSAGVVGAR